MGKTSLAEALLNSYTIAPTVAVASLLLSLPTAYAFGRMTFRGKAVAEMLTLIPLVMPGMLIGIFFSAMLLNLNIVNAFISIVIGHTVLTLPYSIRIMSAGFKAVPQDLIDASRDLGSGVWCTFSNAYLPLLKPSLLAALIFVWCEALRNSASHTYWAHRILSPSRPFFTLSLAIPSSARMRQWCR